MQVKDAKIEELKKRINQLTEKNVQLEMDKFDLNAKLKNVIFILYFPRLKRKWL